MRKALIDTDLAVANIIEWDDDPYTQPDGWLIVDATAGAFIGGTYNPDTDTFGPPPETDLTNHAPTEAARLAAVEAIMIGNVLPSGDTPTFETLVTRQNQIIYAGQVFMFEGDDWQAVVGPLNSNATPATYPIGYRKVTGEPVPDAWAVGTAYAVSDRVTYKGHLYTCLTAHTATESWTPTAAPSLWRDDGATT